MHSKSAYAVKWIDDFNDFEILISIGSLYLESIKTTILLLFSSLFIGF